MFLREQFNDKIIILLDKSFKFKSSHFQYKKRRKKKDNVIDLNSRSYEFILYKKKLLSLCKRKN